jgi:hypothetical protein
MTTPELPFAQVTQTMRNDEVVDGYNNEENYEQGLKSVRKMR